LGFGERVDGVGKPLACGVDKGRGVVHERPRCYDALGFSKPMHEAGLRVCEGHAEETGVSQCH
jgi:hypothetical protein